MPLQDLLVPRFFKHVQPNPAASKAAGRPIFDEFEAVEIRFSGDRGMVRVFPAHETEPNATRERGETVTYAMLYNEQYRKFKANETQDVSGTPLSEAPFLTEGRRRELKAMNVHTVEALAAIDGQPLKQLGMGGRENKLQAQAYLARAAGSADVTSLAAEVASLRQQIKDRDELIDNYASKPAKNKYQRGVERSLAAEAEEDEDEAEEPISNAKEDFPEALASKARDNASVAPEPKEKLLEDCSNTELRAYIKRETGEQVTGNPSRATLLARAHEVAGQG